MSLFSELQRRKVFRVAAGYVVSAWVLIQVVETIFPAFGLDEAAFRLLVIVLAIGFIPAVILSWAFELTRDGLVREREREAPADDAESVLGVLKRPRFAVPLGLAVLAAVGTIAALVMQLQEYRAARVEMLPRIEALADQGDLVFLAIGFVFWFLKFDFFIFWNRAFENDLSFDVPPFLLGNEFGRHKAND